jgi:hypothetical protein
MTKEQPKPFHPLADVFPLMEGAEFDALVKDVGEHGLREPITVFEDMILDGRNRERACVEAGAERHYIQFEGDRAAALAFVVSKNIHRRHLTGEQKRYLTVKLLKAAPEKSDREIGRQVKVDGKTVAAVRADLESTAEIPQLEKTIGADGKARRKPKKQAGADGKARRAATKADDQIEQIMTQATGNDVDAEDSAAARRRAYAEATAADPQPDDAEDELIHALRHVWSLVKRFRERAGDEEPERSAAYARLVARVPDQGELRDIVGGTPGLCGLRCFFLDVIKALDAAAPADTDEEAEEEHDEQALVGPDEEDEEEEPQPKKRRRRKEETTTVAEAIAGACEELNELAQEVREVVDSAPEGLNQSGRIQALDETASTLENLDLEPDVPLALGELKVTYEVTPPSKLRSRAARAAEAIFLLRECITVLEAIPDTDDNHKAAKELVAELDNIAYEAESCEFPGMYG